MADLPFPILTSKLFIPRSAVLIDRPHLFDRLDGGLQGKLTLIAAPAGSGKTSLISAWLQESGLPAAWLSLDAADSDPARFITYLVAACRQIAPRVGQVVLDRLHSPQSPPLEDLMTRLINDLAAAALGDHYLLVLDDYHLIEELAIHEAMIFLLDHLPLAMHLILITREDPPFPLPQLRVRRQVIELRAHDLRFTAAETADFFNTTAADLSLSATDIARLQRRTEGWVAGLQLAALSMQQLADPSSFIEAFAGDDRYVVDYLISEVLAQQPPDVLEFLLQTSILKQFTARLCEVVTGQANVNQTLAYLEKRHLFLIALDSRREWYRYHHLFADLLSHRLKQIAPAQVSTLHGLAADWYREQKLIDDAIYHALAGEDFDNAADLIEQVGLQMIGRGRLSQVQRWIDSLPATFTRQQPYLLVLLAWVSVLHLQPDRAEKQLAYIEPGLDILADHPELRQEVACQLALLRGYITRLRYDLPTSISHIKQAIQLLPDNNRFLQCTAPLNLGGNYWVLGDFGLVITPLQQAVAFLDFADTTYPALVAAGYLTNAYRQQGRLGEADRLFRQVEQALAARGHSPPALAYMAIEQGAWHYERNDLVAATACLTQAIDLGENLDRIVNIGRAQVVLAWIKQVRGQAGEAAVLLEKAAAKRPPSVAEYDHYRVRLWLVQGDRAAAETWAEAYARQRGPGRPWRGLNELTYAHILLADERVEQALDIATTAEAVARSAETLDWVIRALSLKAVCYQTLGDQGQALVALDQALSLAEPEGYCRTFVDYGPLMQHLLQLAVGRQIASAYAGQLLAAFPPLESPKDGRVPTQPISSSVPPISSFPVEPLTDRELSILRLMAAGLSNQQIGTELHLSVNTVKWYSSQIYGKLNARKRAEAVDRAHELGLF